VHLGVMRERASWVDVVELKEAPPSGNTREGGSKMVGANADPSMEETNCSDSRYGFVRHREKNVTQVQKKRGREGKI